MCKRRGIPTRARVWLVSILRLCRLRLQAPEEPIMTESTIGASIERAIRNYIQACNDGDAERIAASFASDAVHYFPNVPKWSGASTIGDGFSTRVQALGQLWTVDRVLVDADRREGALEWTRFDKEGRVVRGVDWFVFEPESFRIREIRAYGAAPIQHDLARQELQDFDYAGRRYPMSRPA
jgi:methyltransferase